MIKAIIFDCFGVVYRDNFGDLYEYFGGNLETDHDFIHETFFRISKGEKLSASKIFSKHLGVDEKEWRKQSGKNRGFNYELLKYIKKLQSEYKLGLLSNVGPKGLGFHVDFKVLEDHFDQIVESAKIGFAKPEARAYEVAADMLDVRLDESVFIDDRPEYIIGAQAVGMRTILFETTDKCIQDIEELLNSTQNM